jgi:NitT/TauT family transport system permease protein
MIGRDHPNGRVPLSLNVAESEAAPATPDATAPVGRGAAVSADRVAAAGAGVLALALAALAALAVHLFLPNGQTPEIAWTDALAPWLHPYPILLETLLAAALLLAAAQWTWPPLRAWLGHFAPLLAVGVLAFCAWDLITLKLNWMTLPYFPGPEAVLGALVEDRDLLFESTWHSLLLLVTGYGVGVTAGLVIGVLIGWYAPVRYWGMPVLKILGPLPATALIPLVMTFSSQSFVSAAALIGFAVWFPVTMLTAAGVSNVRISYLDVARTLGAGRGYLIFRVALPAAMPNIFLGLFMGLGASFLTLIVAETVGVQAGLGWYLTWQQGYVEYGKVYAALLIMAVFFSTLMTLLFKVRDYVLRWQKGVLKW